MRNLALMSLLGLLLSGVASAQTRHASGVVQWQGYTIRPADAVAFWDGNNLRLLLFEDSQQRGVVTQLKNPGKRAKFLPKHKNALVTIKFHGGATGKPAYTREDVAGIDFRLTDPPGRSGAGGVGGGNFVSVLSGDFATKAGSSVEVKVNVSHKGTSFEASCPVWAWGSKYVTK